MNGDRSGSFVVDTEDIQDCSGATATKRLGVGVVSLIPVVLFLCFSINKIVWCVCVRGFNPE